MKKVVSLLAAAAMFASMLTGCGNRETVDNSLDENYRTEADKPADAAGESAPAGEEDYSEHVDLVFYMLGDAPADLQKVQDAINAILQEKVNASVEFQFSTWTDWGEKYKLALTTKGADLIYTANWNSFGQLAQSGAFLPLDQLLDTVSPDLKAAIDPAALDACRVGGQVMTVPCLWKQYTCPGIEYREDLRKKYDLPVPDSTENLKAYLAGIQENEPQQGLLASGASVLAFEDPQYLMSAYGLKTPVENPTAFEDYWFSDKFVEDMKLYKEWLDLGFWSRSALSDTTDPYERYESGLFVAMPWGNNPNKYATRVEQWSTQHPEWETAYYAYGEKYGYVWASSPTSDATAITKDCKNPERAMKVLELLIMDEELNLLTQYGIRGEHYEVAEDGTYRNLDSGFGYEALNAWSLRNPAYKLANGQGGKLLQDMFDYYGAIIEEKGTPSVEPAGGFSEDYSAYAAEKAAVEDVVSEYLKPLEAGTVEDVDAAVAVFREKVTAAGLEVVREGWKQQWLAYCGENGLQ